MSDFDLERFVRAQDADGIYDRAIAELRRGRKHSHWMWFVFPQIAGLGRSATARHFAISSLAEARAYLAHPVLGPRLRECSTIISTHHQHSARDILGEVDALKLRSSMTLFAHADPGDVVFARVLQTFFAGKADAATNAELGL